MAASCPLTIAQLTATTAARITCLNSAAFDQGKGYNNKWAETKHTGTVLEAGSPMGHLTFAVIAGRSVNTENNDDRFDDFVQTRTPLQVVFTYHVRTGADSQVPDERLASDAALQISRAMMRPWPDDNDASIPDDRVVNLVSPWSALVSTDGEWLLITTEFDVLHELDLSIP
ncbi:MAG: hypothetical protein ACTSWM_04840 [Alphaproteobacteria bacterium]